MADDTNVDIFLLFHYQAESLKSHEAAVSTQTRRAFIDTTATVQSLKT